jgi:hypothetical protein
VRSAAKPEHARIVGARFHKKKELHQMCSKQYPRIFITMIIVLTSFATAVFAADAKLAAGAAAGTFTVGGKETKLAYAAAFVDQKDERKPVILIVSDRQLPASTWKTETDFMMATMKQTFIGVVFFIDKKGEVYRTDYYDGTDFPTSTNGIFDLKLDAASGKDLSGTAVSTESAAKTRHPVKLDVKFHATR